MSTSLIAALGWAVLVAAALLAPADVEPLPDWLTPWIAAGLDKAIHCVLFFVQAMLLGRASGWRWAAAALAAAYGGALELLQGTVESRSFELADLLADGLGAAAWAAVDRWRHRLSYTPLAPAPGDDAG